MGSNTSVPSIMSCTLGVGQDTVSSCWYLDECRNTDHFLTIPAYLAIARLP